MTLNPEAAEYKFTATETPANKKFDDTKVAEATTNRMVWRHVKCREDDYFKSSTLPRVAHFPDYIFELLHSSIVECDNYLNTPIKIKHFLMQIFRRAIEEEKLIGLCKREVYPSKHDKCNYKSCIAVIFDTTLIKKNSKDENIYAVLLLNKSAKSDKIFAYASDKSYFNKEFKVTKLTTFHNASLVYNKVDDEIGFPKPVDYHQEWDYKAKRWKKCHPAQIKYDPSIKCVGINSEHMLKSERICRFPKNMGKILTETIFPASFLRFLIQKTLQELDLRKTVMASSFYNPKPKDASDKSIRIFVDSLKHPNYGLQLLFPIYYEGNNLLFVACMSLQDVEGDKSYVIKTGFNIEMARNNARFIHPLVQDWLIPKSDASDDISG
jgi:hypothetical protein